MSYLQRQRAVNRRYGSLGDVICLEGDCVVGEQLVNQMITFFDAVGPRVTFSANPITFKQNILAAAAGGTPKQREFWAKFGSTYSEIVNPYFDLETETTVFGVKKRSIPFSLACCAIKDLGRKAQILSQQGHDFLGTQAPAQTTVKDPFDPNNGLFGGAISGLMSIIKMALVVGVGVVAYNALKKG